MNIFRSADLLLPQVEEMEKWSVIACDQFTSQPEYWAESERTVGNAPSALRLVLPEAYLKGDYSSRVDKINQTMEEYVKKGIFKEYKNAYVYVERTLADGSVRKGILGVVDLEEYDYTPGSTSAIRASERTVVERIPPRKKIRERAALELPHILLLCDDEGRCLIEPIADKKQTLPKLYDFELMQGGGRICGWLLSGKEAEKFDAAMENYAKTAPQKYADLKGAPLLFAVGDGNHSLATAKACYEDLKAKNKDVGATSRARYAMVELENIHDEAQKFEPIHRIVTGVNVRELMNELNKITVKEGSSVTWYAGKEHGTVYLDGSKGQLAVAALQPFLDRYLGEHGGEIDYIHGDDVVKELAKEEGAIGFLLPPMEKGQLFRGIVADGVLPRKTFSMGHAQEKRYYLEARKIR